MWLSLSGVCVQMMGSVSGTASVAQLVEHCKA